MSFAVHALPIEQINQLPIEQCISTLQQGNTLPSFCQLNQDNLLLSAKLTLNSTIKANTVNVDTDYDKENKLELVIFSDLSFELLQQLTSQCQIKIQALNAINHRNNQTSYRFNVSCEDFVAARQQLAQFSLHHKIEAVIINNAASLALPGLLVMDMDSTTIEIECIDEIAVLAGVGEQVAAVTELAMQGQLDFAQSLHQRVATLKDAPESILADVAKNIPLMPGLEVLIKHLKQHHWRIAIASGGFTYFAEHLQQLLELDAVFANTLEIVEQKLTGKVLGDVVDAQVKANSLSLLREQYDIDEQQTVAMGDGANDILMMNAASLGVAFHAKPIVLAQADATISHTGLDCLLHWLR